MIALPALAACNGSDDFKYYIETPEDNMHIKASAAELNINFLDEDNEVITFSWDNAADRGPSATIAYDYRIALAENIKSAAITRVQGNSVSYTGYEFNNMLKEWGITPGTAVEVTAEVIATVTDETKYHKPETSYVTILASGYSIPSTDMVIKNVATDPGYNPWLTLSETDEAIELINSKAYSWTGWFETAKPVSFEAADGSWTLSVDGATTFAAPKDGYYTLTVNKSTGEVKWDILIVNNSTTFYGKGSGIKASNPQFVQSALNPEIFSYIGEVVGDPDKVGTAAVSFYIYNMSGRNNFRYVPAVNGTTETGDDAIVLNGPTNNKWSFTRSGNCRIDVNANLMKIKFTYLD